MSSREPARDPVEAQSDRDFVARAARFGIVSVAIAAAIFAMLWVLKGALTPLVAAFVIAYLLDPLIDRLEAARARPALRDSSCSRSPAPRSPRSSCS